MALEKERKSFSTRKRKNTDEGEEIRRKRKKRLQEAGAKTKLDVEEDDKQPQDKHTYVKTSEQGETSNPKSIGRPNEKRKRVKSRDAVSSQPVDPLPNHAVDMDASERPQEADNEHQQISDSKQTRFIVFVGNLPYTTTTPALESHFASLRPASIRHLTKKDDPSKSKGFAFLEFAQFDRMRTCLKLFHHSHFDDGRSPPRKINVELTAGGGGRSKHRKEKLKAKNEKLVHERKRQNRVKREEKPRQRDNPEDALEGGTNTEAPNESGIHPSRRALVKD